MQKRPYRSNTLVQWNARQSIDNPKPLVDKVVEAVLHQQGIPFEHSDEYRNIYSYDKLLEQLEHYDREYYLSEVDPHLQRGLKQAFRMLACPDEKMKLKPVSLLNEAAVLFSTLQIKGDRSAGLTAYGESKFEAFTTGLDKAISILTENKAPAPCLAGFRTQRKEKTRLVWMYPLEMTIVEAVVARPLIGNYNGTTNIIAMGEYSHELGTRLRRSSSKNRMHYSIDYSQFDSTIGPLFIQHAFNAFRSWFHVNEEVYPGVTVNDVFSRIESYFVTTPIVMPNKGHKYPTLYTGKRGGVPSGSYFTQMVDSFTNAALILAADSKFQLGLQDDDIYVLGDDCLFFSNKDSDTLLQRISGFLSNYGFKVNAFKGSHGFATADIEFLGRVWRNGFPLRPMQHIIRGSLYPENYRRYSLNQAERQKQALGVVSSYLLTSYIEDPTVGTEILQSGFHVTPWMSSGFTEYLIRSGFIPGDKMKRAIY